MAKPPKKSKAPKPRRERIFQPIPAGNRVIVGIVGALGAMAMGAGVYGQFVGVAGEPFKLAPWILGCGALLVGAAIWFGWSGDPVLRVGDAGVAHERGGLRRMPWYAVEKVELAGGAVRVTGKDETDRLLTILASLKSQPQAAAWIVAEARARVPNVVEIPEDAQVPSASQDAGELVALEPMQLVGKHCAESGKIIAYEPDARICPKCDRVYHKLHVPERCVCGASLAGLRAKTKSAPAEAPDAKAEAEPIAAELSKEPEAVEEKPG